MKKIVILGCENSHADAFIECVQKKEEFSDIEIVGVYSDDTAAAEKLNAKFGVPVMASYDEAVGKVDGVIVTARHGGKHYPFAKPYIQSGVTMFIDKPVTIDEGEAIEFMHALKEQNAKVTGGSSLRHAFMVKQTHAAQQMQTAGRTVGGIARAPLSSENPHGGFFFYSAHLVEIVLATFGRAPQAVQVTIDSNKNRTVQFFYDSFTVTGLYTEGGNEYYCARFSLNGTQGGYLPANTMKEWYYAEFKEFVDIMKGSDMVLSYEELIAPVFVLAAIDRASESGKVEAVCYSEV